MTGLDDAHRDDAHLDDAMLVTRAQQGYLDAFEMLVERHSAAVYRVALRLLGNRDDAQDVAQDSLVAAWEHLAEFRHESSFSTWLYRIVTRRALSTLTRRRIAVSADLLDGLAAPAPGPAQQAVRHQTADAVTAAVARLPLAQRVVVVLYHFEGLGYTQIATVTRSTVPAVRSHLYRARQALALTLAPWK